MAGKRGHLGYKRDHSGQGRDQFGQRKWGQFGDDVKVQTLRCRACEVAMHHTIRHSGYCGAFGIAGTAGDAVDAVGSGIAWESSDSRDSGSYGWLALAGWHWLARG